MIETIYLYIILYIYIYILHIAVYGVYHTDKAHELRM